MRDENGRELSAQEYILRQMKEDTERRARIDATVDKISQIIDCTPLVDVPEIIRCLKSDYDKKFEVERAKEKIIELQKFIDENQK